MSREGASGGEVAASLIELLRRRAARSGERDAFVLLADGDEPAARLCFGELERAARRVAVELARVAAPGDRVLLLYPSGFDFVAAFFGCAFGGFLAVPAAAPPPRRAERGLARLGAIADDCRPAVVLTTGPLLGLAGELQALAGGLAAPRWLATDGLAAGGEDDWVEPAVTAATPALLQYTSGSTSTPKGVVVSHGNLLFNLSLIQRSFALGEESVAVTWAPFFHDLGLVDGLLEPVYAGYTSYLMPPVAFLQRPLRWPRAISRFRATHSGGPNFAFDLCARKAASDLEAGERLDLSCWQGAYCAAEPIRKETFDRFAAAFAPHGFRAEQLVPGYGLAEATLMVSGSALGEPPVYLAVDREALERDRVVAAPEGAAGSLALVGCGKPRFGASIEVVDAQTRQRLGEREVGEIWIGGPTVAQGYWGRAEETAETFRAQVAGEGEATYLRTGDLGFLAGGELFVTGRSKDLVIIHGRNHYPQDLELTAERSHPMLRPGCGAAFAVEADGEERLVLLHEVERAVRTPAECDEVMAALRQAVTLEHEVEPQAIVLLRPASILKTSSGKIQRRACRAAFLGGDLKVVAEWRRPAAQGSPLPAADWAADRAAGQGAGAIADWLARRLAERAAVDPATVNRREPFVRYGLDSVAAVALTGDLGDWLGRELPPTLVYEHPTIEALARHLAGEAATPAPGPEPAEPARLAEPAEPVAIVGIACRLPGARDPEALWRLLRDGVDAVSELAPGGADAADGADALQDWVREPAGDDPRIRRGGFLDGVDGFDPHAFGLAPHEAERMDPQQRLLLELAWEALEDAGMAPEPLAGSATAVFIGISGNDYARLQSRATWLADEFSGTGAALSIAANRLSYFFGFRGPSVALDTACSSSLVAVHLACRSLASGESTLALAGGVNLILAPRTTALFAGAGLISAAGRCRAFDAEADGYVRGEGAGLVLLKPLSRALADGDRIYALIRGTAVNQDGRSNGLTAPSGAAQEAVLREAYRRAGVAPAEVSYVEAHGSGTPLGDPIEARALGAVVGAGRPADRPCALGSIKTNLGHLEAAAGIAGLLKTALALDRGEIPPSLHFTRPNPHIPFSELGLAVQTRLAPWPAGERPALAGVSSFGFGGTNAHVVLEAAPAAAAGGASRPWQVLAISAHSGPALARSTADLAAHLEAHPEVELADLAHTLQVGRRGGEYRRMLVARGAGEALAALRGGDPSVVLTHFERASGRPVAFLFPGVGDHYVGMAQGLYAGEPVFRRELDRCAEAALPELGVDLREILFAPSAGAGAPGAASAPGGVDLRRLLGRGGTQADEAARRLDRTLHLQPTLFAVEHALAGLWASWGVRPQAMLGYSLGEHVAACLAGVFSLEDALALVVRRARLLEELPAGSMLAVSLAEAELTPWLDPELSLAALNGPHLSVVSGPPAAVAGLEGRLAEAGVVCRRLPTAQAFHSRQLEPLFDRLVEIFAGVTLHPPALPFVSNLTGDWIRPEEATDPRYWARQSCSTVRFAAGLERLAGGSQALLLEVGPGQSLGSLARQRASQEEGAPYVVSSLRHAYDPQPDDAVLARALGKLWLAGVTVDWAAYRGDERRQRLALPTYPFERQRCWIDAAPEVAPAPPAAGKRAEIADWFYLPTWQRALAPAADPRGEAALAARWLLFLDDGGLGERLAERLRKLGREVWTVVPGAGFRRLGEASWEVEPGRRADYESLLAELGAAPGGVVHLWSVGPGAGGAGADAFRRAQERGFYSLLALAGAWTRKNPAAAADVWMVTSGAWRVTGGELLMPEKATLAPACRVVSQEYLNLSCRMLDLDSPLPEGAPHKAAEAAVDRLLGELTSPAAELDAALRGADRWLPRLEPLRLPADAEGAAARLRQRGVYLVTGGLGEVGFVLSEHLARTLEARLVLVGRSALPPRQSWEATLADPDAGEALKLRLRRVQALEGLGAEVMTAAADVSDAAALRRVVEETIARFGALHGVVHAAGVLDERTIRPIQDLGREECEAQFAPKAYGLYALEEALAGVDLDFCVLLSSLTSILGGLQFAAYAAANGFMDAFAERRAGRGESAWLSMGSDIWRLGKERWGVFGATVAAYEMEPEEGVEVFRRLLTVPQAAHVAVSTGDLQARIGQWLRPGARQAPERAAAAPRHRRPVLATDYVAPSTDVERTITSIWQELLGVERVGVHDNFFDLGGHSLLATRFASRLREYFPIDLSIRTLFETPTPAGLAHTIETVLWAAAGAPAEVPTGIEVPAATGGLERGEL